jgi:peptidoglycan/xylan/chitin deacetylase (PgdA/CDA1 family)
MIHTVEGTAPLNIEPAGDQQRHSARTLHLLYHELRSSESQYSYVTNASLFAQHLDLYVRLRGAENNALIPEITFDDGHVSNHELAAPMLQSHGMLAMFFITAGWTGNKSGYMGWDELRSLHKAGHTIGGHGWTHTLLTHCDDRELDRELGETRLTLEDKLGAAVVTMSLPGGRYNRRVLKACKDAGYEHVYTSVPQSEPILPGATVGRLNILGDMQTEWIARLFAPDGKLLKELARSNRRKDAVKKLLGDKMYFRLWAMVNRQEQDEDAAQ